MFKQLDTCPLCSTHKEFKKIILIYRTLAVYFALGGGEEQPTANPEERKEAEKMIDEMMAATLSMNKNRV